MKKGKRIVTLLMAGILTMTSAGCGAKKTADVENDKTQLYVGVYNGGVGENWLKEAIAKFEEKYKDTSFEEGKKGVQVIIADSNTTTMIGPTLLEKIDTTSTEVFFTEGVFYHEWVKKNKMYDLTDIMNEKLTEFGEEKSVADKIDKDFLESMTVDGKVYAFPYWMGSYGIVYNATLFDEKGWYFAADGGFTNASGKLAAGPDGKEGSYDDGMPATYDQFFTLMEEINRDNVVPLQWAGGTPEYFTWFMGSLFADYEGYDDLMLNVNLEGTTEVVKPNSVNAETGAYETETIAITPENGYELARQDGLLVTLQFAQKLLRGMGYYYDTNPALSGSYKQKDAQIAFVRNTSNTSNKPVAMIIDGSWWENEADSAFEATYGAGATKFDSEFEYKCMPLPKANESLIGSENIWAAPLSNYCFLNPNIKEEKVELAGKFLQFCHTDESMTAFTSTTGMLKPYDYTVDESKMTSYGKSMIEAIENSRVAFPYGSNDLYTYAPTSFYLASFYTSELESGKHGWNIPAQLTQKNGDNFVYDYVDYFNGIYKYRKDTLWRTFSEVLK